MTGGAEHRQKRGGSGRKAPPGSPSSPSAIRQNRPPALARPRRVSPPRGSCVLACQHRILRLERPKLAVGFLPHLSRVDQPRLATKRGSGSKAVAGCGAGVGCGAAVGWRSEEEEGGCRDENRFSRRAEMGSHGRRGFAAGTEKVEAQTRAVSGMPGHPTPPWKTLSGTGRGARAKPRSSRWRQTAPALPPPEERL